MLTSLSSNRRALFVAPIYDGAFATHVPGSAYVANRLSELLIQYGGYDTRVSRGIVKRRDLRSEIRDFVNGGDQLFFYLYGHGLLASDARAVFVTSDGCQDDEGINLSEIVASVFGSKAREAVLIFDCCYSGGSINSALSELPRLMDVSYGRALFASCLDTQQGWTERNPSGETFSAFARYILEGLGGAAANPATGTVRANSLADYVTEKSSSWKQQPVALHKEGGGQLCIITSGFDKARHKNNSAELVAPINVPFLPSQNFVGRQAELETLCTALIGGSKPIAVSASLEGMGGIGKTELAIQFVYMPEVRSHFSTILWLDASAPLEPQIRRFIWPTSTVRTELDALALKYEFGEKLRWEKNSLIVLDNTEDWDAVSDYIPAGCALLVTTRNRDFGGNAFKHFELDVLTPEAARKFLLLMEPRLTDDPALEPLLQTLDGHALALELAAATITALGISANRYLERKRSNTRPPLDAIRQVKYGKTVEECLELTWNTLKRPEARQLWKRASLFAPTSAHRDLLRVSFIGADKLLTELRYIFDQMDVIEVRDAYLAHPVLFDEAYAELRRRNIFSRMEGQHGERWSMHRHVRDYARSRVTKLDYAAHTLALAEWLREPTFDIAEATPHIVAAILDSEKFSSGSLGYRYFEREVLYRGIRGWRDSAYTSPRYLLRYINRYLSDPMVLKVLFEGLTDVNEDVRAEAVKILEESDVDVEIINVIAKTLGDLSPSVRATARRALIANAGPRVINTLSQIARSTDECAAREAAATLRGIGESAIPALRSALESNVKEARQEAAIALGERGDRSGLQVICQVINSRNLRAVRRNEAFRALFQCDKKQFCTILAKYLNARRLHDFAQATVAISSVVSQLGESTDQSLADLARLLLSASDCLEALLKSDVKSRFDIPAVMVKLAEVTSVALTDRFVALLFTYRNAIDIGAVSSAISERNKGSSFDLFFQLLQEKKSYHITIAATKLQLFWPNHRDAITAVVQSCLQSADSEIRFAGAQCVKACPDADYSDVMRSVIAAETDRKRRKELEEIGKCVGVERLLPKLPERATQAGASGNVADRTGMNVPKRVSWIMLPPRAGYSRLVFMQPDEAAQAIYGEHGQTLMEAAKAASVPGIEAECGGACACATCHVYVDANWMRVLGERESVEEDMLDFASDNRENSRLSCQIKVTPQLDGLVVEVPTKQS